MREKVGKSRFTVFSNFVAPEGRKVGSLKRRVRSQLARWEMKNCTPLWREAHVQVKMYKTHQVRTTFGSWDVEKVHAVVARSTVRKKKMYKTHHVRTTFGSCESARRCGAKHIFKSKCTKHTTSGPLLEVEMSKKCTPLWSEAHFEVKYVKNTRGSDHFWTFRCRKSARRCGAKHISKSTCTKHTRGSDHFWMFRCRKSACRCGAKHISKSTCTKHTSFGPLLEVAKVHAVVARSTFSSQNVKNTPRPDHFWKLRCRKSARRCGAKHIFKSKCTKHTTSGPLLEVEMSKKCTPLWSEAHFEVKYVKNTRGSDHFWTFRCRKSARRCGAKHISKSKCQKHQGFGPLLDVQMSKKCMPLWREAHFEVKMFKTLGVRTTHYTTLHYTTLHYTILHYTTLHSSTLHYTTLHSSTLHYTEWHYITLHYTTLRSTTLHYTTSHYTTLQYTPLHFITLYYTIFRYTSLPYTTLHSITLQLQLQLHNYTPLHSTTLNYTTLHYITLHYTTFRHTPLHHTTLHYTTLHWMTLHHR